MEDGASRTAATAATAASRGSLINLVKQSAGQEAGAGVRGLGVLLSHPVYILVSVGPAHVEVRIDTGGAGASFLISRFWFQGRPPFMGSEASTFLGSNFSILIAQIA